MNPRLRAAAEVVMVYGLLGWVYVAAYAAAFPDELNHAIAAVLPVRRDTFGVLAFAGSASAATLLRGATGRIWVRRPKPEPGWRPAVLNTVAVYGLLAWAYLCVNSLTHPWTVSQRLTHFTSSPSEGTAAVAGFTASAAALFLARSSGPGSRPDGDHG
jgi:hypothetical protein